MYNPLIDESLALRKTSDGAETSTTYTDDKPLDLIPFEDSNNAHKFTFDILFNVTDVTTGGATAARTITLSSNPENNDAMTFNGVTFTFKTTPESGHKYQVQVGASLAESINNLVAKIYDDIRNPLLSWASYANDSNTGITITFNYAGTIGNAYSYSWAFTTITGNDTTEAAATTGSDVLGGGTNNQMDLVFQMKSSTVGHYFTLVTLPVFMPGNYRVSFSPELARHIDKNSSEFRVGAVIGGTGSPTITYGAFLVPN